MKKLLSITLCLVMALSLCVTAGAETHTCDFTNDIYCDVCGNYDLKVAGVQVTSENLSGDGWVYEPSTNTITLTNYSNGTECQDVIASWYYTGQVNIVLEGSSTINTSSGYSFRSQEGSFNIKGSGTASIRSIYVAQNLTITDSTINATNSISVPVSNTSDPYTLTICGNANVTASHMASNYINISDNANVRCSTPYNAAIQGAKELNVSGGTVVVESAKNPLHSYGNITISGGTVTAKVTGSENGAGAANIKPNITMASYEVIAGANESEATKVADPVNTAYHEQKYVKIAPASGGGTPTPPAEHKHDTTEFESIVLAGTMVGRAQYYLDANSTASGDVTIAENANITLCLNGKTLDMGQYRIEVRGSLTICDCQGGGKITSWAYGNSDNTIRNYGTLTLQSGTVECTNPNNKGTVRAIHNRQDFVMTGGVVSGPTGIYCNGNPTLRVSGGTVIGEPHSAVYLDAGQLVIAGNPSFSGANGDVALHKHGANATSIKMESTTYNGPAISIRLVENNNSIANRTAPVVVSGTDMAQFRLTNEGYELKVENGDLVLAKESDVITYTVTLKPNGGTGEDVVVPNVSGNYHLPNCEFIRDGFTFDKWAVGSVDGEQYAVDSPYTVSADTTFYALWKETDGSGDDTPGGGDNDNGNDDDIQGGGDEGVGDGDEDVGGGNDDADSGNDGGNTGDNDNGGTVKPPVNDDPPADDDADTPPTTGGTSSNDEKDDCPITVESGKTFDPGVAIYAGMALMSAAGAVYVCKKR